MVNRWVFSPPESSVVSAHHKHHSCCRSHVKVFTECALTHTFPSRVWSKALYHIKEKYKLSYHACVFTVGVVAINLTAISLVESHIAVFFKSSDRLSRCVVAGGTWSLCGSPEMPLIPFLSPLPSLSAFIRLQSHTSRRQAWFMALVCVCLLSRMWVGYGPLAGYFALFLYIFATCEVELLFI